MITNWLVTLRLTPNTSIGIPTVNGKTIRVSLLSKGEMVVVWLSLKLSRLRSSMISLQMYSPKLRKIRSFYLRSAPPMSNINISNEGVIKMMKGLNPSKALGPDELHPRVLKELAVFVLYLLICSNNLLIRVKSPRNGLWLTSVHYIRKVKELYQVIIVQNPRHVFLARCLNT